MTKNILSILTVLILLSLSLNSWATDYTQDANCQAAWLFEEGSGTSSADSSQNSNTANFKGDGEPPFQSASPPAGYSTYYINFDGVDDYLYCGNHSSTNFVGNTEDFSVIWWNKFTAGNDYERYFTRQDGATGDGWTIGRNINEAVLIIERSSDQDYLELFGNGIDFSASWAHYAVQYDWSEDKFRVYTNGSLTTDWTSIGGAGAFSWADDDDLYIGAKKTDFQCESEMDEIALFNDLPDSTEINDIMDNGLEGAVVANPQVIIISKKEEL